MGRTSNNNKVPINNNRHVVLQFGLYTLGLR